MTDRPTLIRPPYVAVIGDGDPRGPDAHRILDGAASRGLGLWAA